MDPPTSFPLDMWAVDSDPVTGRARWVRLNDGEFDARRDEVPTRIILYLYSVGVGCWFIALALSTYRLVLALAEAERCG
jgi:hypothetical protein